MSKKKHKDFWNMTAEDQMEDLNLLDDMEEKGEINIFSLGKIPKHYTGVESEIQDDIDRVFGNKKFDPIKEGEEYEVPEDSFDVQQSESFIASLKSDEYDDLDDEVHFDPTVSDQVVKPENNDVKKEESKPNKPENEKKHNHACDSLSPIWISFNDPFIQIKDAVVTSYYKVVEGDDAIRYIDKSILCDDSVLREIMYLIRYIISFRHPTALYKFEEFERIFDEVKGEFESSKMEDRFMFIDYDDYVAGYYLGKNPLDQLLSLNIPKDNARLADIIVGLAVDGADINHSFTKDDFKKFYDSKSNEINKKLLVDLVNESIKHTDDILMLDVHSYNKIFEKSEKILEKYCNFNIDDDDDDEIEDDIPDLNDDSEVEYDATIEDDIRDIEDDLDNENDEDNDDEDATEVENPSYTESESETSTDIDIDNLLEEALADESNDDEDATEVENPLDTETDSMPIDKVAVNNPNKDSSMVIEVTRKTHPTN